MEQLFLSMVDLRGNNIKNIENNKVKKEYSGDNKLEYSFFV